MRGVAEDSQAVLSTPVSTPGDGAQPRTPPRHNARKRWLAAAIVVSAAALAWFFYWRSAPQVQYITTRVDRGNIDSVVTTTGNLNAVITVQVGSQVSGIIKALYADFNTKVKKGQLVALIDPTPFQAAVNQAKATLESAKAAALTAKRALAKAESDLTAAQAAVASQKANLVKAQSAVDLAKLEADRRQALVKLNATSQEDYDTAKANYDQAVASLDAARASVTAAEASADSAAKAIDIAEAQLQQANAMARQDEAALEQAQYYLDHTRIVAPVDGTIESRNMDVGQTVAASFQAPTIFLIAQDLTKMQVDTNVGEADVANVKVGQRATFTVDAFPGRVFAGEVFQIRQAPINVQNVITYDVVVAVSNPDLKLFPGMTANVTISTGHAENALRVPKSALRFRPRTASPSGQPAAAARKAPAEPGVQTVFVLDQGQLKAEKIRLGMSDAAYTQVIGGALREGQELVVGMKGPAPSSTTPPAAGGSTRRIGL